MGRHLGFLIWWKYSINGIWTRLRNLALISPWLLGLLHVLDWSLNYHLFGGGQRFFRLLRRILVFGWNSFNCAQLHQFLNYSLTLRWRRAGRTWGHLLNDASFARLVRFLSDGDWVHLSLTRSLGKLVCRFLGLNFYDRLWACLSYFNLQDVVLTYHLLNELILRDQESGTRNFNLLIQRNS